MSWSHQNATTCMLEKRMEHLSSHLNDLIYLFTTFSHTARGTWWTFQPSDAECILILITKCC